ncbi:MAG TPA: PilN domain-containing protein [Anaeromyxobacter sp.]|nr:PilN domain-containing protein [Anaeromyxobacter sp.]
MVRINLLPVRVSKKKEAGKQQLLLFVLVLVVGLLANFWFHQRRAAELDEVEKRVGKTRADIAQLDKIIGEVKSIRTQQQQLQEKLDVLDKLKQGRTGPVRMLEELAGIVPRRLWLKKMEEKAGKVTFSGAAASVDDVSVFMGALKNSKYFADVELKKTESKTEGTFHIVEFTISALGKYSPGVQAAEVPAAGGKGPAIAPQGKG